MAAEKMDLHVTDCHGEISGAAIGWLPVGSTVARLAAQSLLCTGGSPGPFPSDRQFSQFPQRRSFQSQRIMA